MKKILFILFLSSLLQVNAQLNFKINSNNELVWSKIYDSHINIQSQKINLVNKKKGVAIYLRNIHSADLTVQHKDNQTRFLVKNIKYSSWDIDSSSLTDVSAIVIKQKKGEYNKFFLKRDSSLLDKIIEQSIKSLIEETW